MSPFLIVPTDTKRCMTNRPNCCKDGKKPVYLQYRVHDDNTKQPIEMDKDLYEAPSFLVAEVKVEGVICVSGSAGIKQMEDEEDL